MSAFKAVLVIETRDELTDQQLDELKTDLDKLDKEKYKIILTTGTRHYRNTTGNWESKTHPIYIV